MQLNIDKPCSENWDKMIPNDAGRHCSSCDKTVVDIRSKSNLEIKSLVETSDSVCAIANKHQLYNYQYVRPIKRLAFALLIVFGNGLFSISASAQETTQQLKETYLENDSLKSKVSISGVITDEFGEPLPFVSIGLYQNNKPIIGSTTDFNGHYTINLNDDYTNKKYNLMTSFVGYSTIEKKDIIIGSKSIVIDFSLSYPIKDLIQDEIMGALIAPNISRDPSNANKTTFSKEEIQRSPNR